MGALFNGKSSPRHRKIALDQATAGSPPIRNGEGGASLPRPVAHVGFHVGEDGDGSACRILGGNQSDSVSLAWVRNYRLFTARLPATVAPPIPEKLVATLDEPLSWNEALGSVLEAPYPLHGLWDDHTVLRPISMRLRSGNMP
jgi:hypothetical protein